MVSKTPIAHPINLWVMVWDLWDRPSINTYGTALVWHKWILQYQVHMMELTNLVGFHDREIF